MRHGALFNGIGGFQLAAHWMGWENIFHCEIDKFCNQVVKKNFPESICYEDIKQTDFTPWRGAIDILTGGFPCQPYSSAGKRLGKEDERHLWPEMLRAIREIRPTWIVGENVRGLTNWNGGVVFDEVQSDMEAEGYEVLPFLLPACGINAPHRRERIWFITHSNGDRRSRYNQLQGDYNSRIKKGMAERHEPNPLFSSGAFTDANIINGFKRRVQQKECEPKTSQKYIGPYDPRKIGGDTWDNFPTQSPICGRDDGIPDRLDRIKALGNAIVPQVSLEIFKAIEAYENL